MRKLFLIALGCMVPTLACAQEWKPAVEKWRSCADAAAARYAKSTESAPVVARLATLACTNNKKEVLEAITKSEGSNFAEHYVESVERYYIDILSVRVIEGAVSSRNASMRQNAANSFECFSIMMMTRRL